MAEMLAPGGVVGILGGGQLGRMLSVAAARLGLRTVIYDPAPEPPAGHVAWKVITAPWEDRDALAEFAALVDVVTYEFENVPVASLDAIEARVPIRPGRQSLTVSQDRLVEKGFLRDLGLETARFAAVDGPADLAAALAAIGRPAILKSRRLGYDGKGQARITEATDPEVALAAIGNAPAILEAVVDFDAEISVILTRGIDGATCAYEPGLNRHEDGILRRTRVPSGLPRPVIEDAIIAAGRIAGALDHVGVLAVEFFVCGGRVLVNEIAPRVHNSGHWTQDGCVIDQFENHIRAIAGWPIGDGRRVADVEMENLIGADIERIPALARDPAVALHLYGKAVCRPGRKMGHANHLRPMQP